MRSPRTLLALVLPLISASAQQVDVMKWREDLAVLAAAVRSDHVSPFHSCREADFDQALAALSDELPELGRYQAVVGLMRIGALIGDGHSGLRSAPSDPNAGFTPLPMRVMIANDGLVLRAVPERHRHLLGARVLSIGEISAEEVLSRLHPLVACDNESGFRDRAPFVMRQNEVLRVIGAAGEGGVHLTLAIGEQRMEIELVAGEPAPLANAEPLPPEHAAAPHAFSYQWLPDGQVLYMRIDQLENRPAESFSEYCARAFAVALERSAGRVIIDLRGNGGGRSGLMWPLIKNLIRSGFDRRGRGIVLIGGRTFSAAQNLVNMLEQLTDVAFVGQPTGASPVHYGDSVTTRLPNSGLRLDLASVRHQTSHAKDRRSATAPDVLVPILVSDLRRGHDATLAEALAYDAEFDLVEVIESSETHADAVDALRDIAGSGPWAKPPVLYQWIMRTLLRDQFEHALELAAIGLELWPEDRQFAEYQRFSKRLLGH